MRDLTDYYCAFSHKNGAYLRYFKLNKNGSIEDIGSKGHDNERYWEIKNDNLIIYNNRSIRTSIYTINKKETEDYGNKIIILNGIFNDTIELKIVASKDIEDVIIARTQYQHWNDIKNGILSVQDRTVGKFSIRNRQNAEKILIGNYTTIKNNVTLVFDSTDIKTITTFDFSSIKPIQKEQTVSELPEIQTPTGRIDIGNDVYISDNVTIYAGSSIKNGAIIMSDTVVTGEVPAYAIVDGKSGTVIGYRYTQDIIEKMNKISWWNWDKNVVDERILDITSEDINKFIEKYYM